MTGRPDRVFDPAVQHERTALAWERTSVAQMVGGALLLNHAINVNATWAEILGLLVAATGAITLLWSARRYEDLHGNLRSGTDVTHVAMLRSVTWVTVILSAASVLLLFITMFD
jgi:putative membrane protein